MATIKTKTYTNVRPLYTPDDADSCYSSIPVEFPSTALAANDIIALCTIPAGLRHTDYKIIFPDVDSNGAPAFAFSIGVANAGLTDLATVYAAGITAGQSSAIYRPTTGAHFEQDYTVDRVLAIKVTTAAATYAGSGKVGRVMVELEG